MVSYYNIIYIYTHTQTPLLYIYIREWERREGEREVNIGQLPVL